MLTSLRYRLKRLFSHIWAPISAYAVLGLLAAVIAVALRDLIPSSWAFKIGADAIDGLLNILASSMLAVTTFSLSIMLSAFAAASSTATPRAFQLLKADQTAQQVLASFIGAFIFSLVGIVSLKIGIYGQWGRVILFGATILVLVLIIFNLVRWIGHLTDFGRLGDTMERVEVAAADAMTRRLDTPWLGANPMHRATPPEKAVPLRSGAVGHIQFINLSSLNAFAEDAGCSIYIAVLPGEFVYTESVLAHVLNGPVGPEYDALLADIRGCFEIGMHRSFDQDPRFGMITLSEIASRALSPAVNDPGTAVAVITRILRILSIWQTVQQPDVDYPRLYAAELSAEEMLRESLLPLARDGASNFQVQHAVQDCLIALTNLAPQVFGPAAVHLSDDCLEYAMDGLMLQAQRDQVRRRAEQLSEAAAAVVPNR